MDCKLLLQDDALNYYPIMIEYKGYADKLVKLNSDGHPDNFNKKDNSPNHKNINTYAVNGAVHYANALLEFTSYTDIIAIGVTGSLNISGSLKTQIGVYFVSKSNYGVGQKIGEFSDLSFLKPENFQKFIQQVKELKLTPAEIDKIHKDRENRIEDALTKINERLYNKQENLSALSRIHLVSASIMANLGVAGKVQPLEAKDLPSSTEEDYTDGDVIFKKIKSFLNAKGLPKRKQEQILNSLSVTIKDENLSKPKNGQSLLKEIFMETVDDLGYFYKVGLDTDFTGKLFNIMFRWLSFAGDDQNDVVLTPRYVAYLMAKLACVNKNSYVWDFATGSGGLLVAAMNLMLQDAKTSINSPDELRQKENQIKAEQILGIEVLPEIYMLAVLNMILMGDGSSNILQENSLTNFNGKYGYGKENQNFPADVFLLNPPYSAQGNGMIFVEKALNMMHKGYASIIIKIPQAVAKPKSLINAFCKNTRFWLPSKCPTIYLSANPAFRLRFMCLKLANHTKPNFPWNSLIFKMTATNAATEKKPKPAAIYKTLTTQKNATKNW